MDARHHALNTAKADFYLTIAHAMFAPTDEALAQAMLSGDLTVDLDELDQEIGYGLADEIRKLQLELDAIKTPLDLLVLYSQLFLAPPRKVQLNAASYLDGSFNGGTVLELEQCYAAHGLVRSEVFHDLADHVSVQLEFVAHLYGRAEADCPPLADAFSGMTAGSFIANYPERWIFPLGEDIRQVSEAHGFEINPYRTLLQILGKAVEYDAEYADHPVTATERRENALRQARQKRAERAISAEELQEIRTRLSAQGLSVDHLDPDRKDDPWQGWEAMVPPKHRR